MLEHALLDEWLETDGRGGFAMGTAAGVRTRRYHGLLVAAPSSAPGRMLLVGGMDLALYTARGRFALSSHEYEPGVIHPDGYRRIESFQARPWPTWVLRAEDGTRLSQEILCVRRTGETLVCFRLLSPLSSAKLELRLLLGGRDYHALHRENSSFRFEPELSEDELAFRPYGGVPQIRVRCNGRYRHEPLFFRSFRYREELARGLDHVEDLAAPGSIELDLTQGMGWVALGWSAPDCAIARAGPRKPDGQTLREGELERRHGQSSLELAADAYLVRRGERHTIIAGYPWFGDWGRDTFIAVRGLCIARGKLAQASAILCDWAGLARNGLLPNYFPDASAEPRYNSVDAGLWYIVAVYDLLGAHERSGSVLDSNVRSRLLATISTLLGGLVRGSELARATDDGLLATGAEGEQLTWMDAKVGDYVVTPRIGKPVEVQALWLNALRIAAELDVGATPEWARRYERGLSSFRSRFWCDETSSLFDVVDVGHQPGTVDASVRPNQVFAAGGLPHALLPAERAQAVLARVENELWTPLGLRTLSPRDGAYRAHYTGDVFARDTAYHMGTAWPWLLGPFVQAWLRARGSSEEARREAAERFVFPWLSHTQRSGLGHVSEIVDGDFPHLSRGAPFQAWSLGELLRIRALVG